MTDRTYRTILGLLLLISLYFAQNWLMYGIIALLFLEGLTNQRVPKLVCSIRKCVSKREYAYVNADVSPEARFDVDSERIWRLIVGALLLISFSFMDYLLFFPWFMGFAIFGAGLSGVCPVLLAIRWAGFK